jgi:hypothetical protein
LFGRQFFQILGFVLKALKSNLAYRSCSSCAENLSRGNSGLVNSSDFAISETDPVPPASAKQ